MIDYIFEWDFRKTKSNITKHGVSFVEPCSVFQDASALSIYDDDHSTQEERWITMGISNTGKHLVVCHTFKKISEDECTIRIFSSRKATKTEFKLYEV